MGREGKSHIRTFQKNRWFCKPFQMIMKKTGEVRIDV